jgi:hypothetical protein
MQSYRSAEALRHPKTGAAPPKKRTLRHPKTGAAPTKNERCGTQKRALRHREDEFISSQRRGKPRLYRKAQAFRWGSISRKAGAPEERSSS